MQVYFGVFIKSSKLLVFTRFFSIFMSFLSSVVMYGCTYCINALLPIFIY